MRTLKHLLVMSTSLSAIAFENKTGWKLDDGGNIVTDSSGNPIMVGDDGKETAIASGYIQRINSESARYRTTARELETKLAAFGDLDPAAAREAIEKTKDIDLTKLVEKGEVDKVRTAITTQYEQKLTDAEKRAAEIAAERDNLLRTNAFSTSKFLNERLAVPRDFVESTYRDRFKIEEGRLVPVGADGQPIYNSRGELASVDEAFEMFISQRTDKDQLLRAPAHSGTGSSGAGGGRGGGNVMRRGDFDKLAPMDKATVGKKVAAGELRLVD